MELFLSQKKKKQNDGFEFDEQVLGIRKRMLMLIIPSSVFYGVFFFFFNPLFFCFVLCKLGKRRR